LAAVGTAGGAVVGAAAAAVGGAAAVVGGAATPLGGAAVPHADTINALAVATASHEARDRFCASRLC
jgi:hypothetical protein